MRKLDVNIVQAHVAELKPDSRYIILLNGDKVTTEEAQRMLLQLDRMGIKNTLAMQVPGDPTNAIKIIEQEDGDFITHDK
jgi:hypothetical protein